MVHRTDVAGDRWGQASPGHDRVCRAALKSLPPRQQSIARTQSFGLLPASQSGGMKCCGLLATAVPPVHAIHLELPAP